MPRGIQDLCFLRNRTRLVTSAHSMVEAVRAENEPVRGLGVPQHGQLDKAVGGLFRGSWL